MSAVARIVALAAACSWTAVHAAVVVDDGDFAGWTFGAYVSGRGPAVGWASAVRVPAGGNPGAHIVVTTSNSGLAGFVATAVAVDSPTTARLAGATITLTMDVQAVPPTPSPGQSVQLILEQNGLRFAVGGFVFSGAPASFAPVTLTGVIDASSVFAIDAPGPPALDGSVPTRFGFSAGMSGFNVIRYDNVRLDLRVASATPPAAIPAVVPWMLVVVAGALAAAGGFHLRR